MFKKNIIVFLLGTLVFATPSFSGEVTDTEWDALGNFIITYYTGTSNDTSNSLGRSIGKAFGAIERFGDTLEDTLFAPLFPARAARNMQIKQKARELAATRIIECTVYNENNKPIGSGFNSARGEVARVTVSLPKKYKNAKLSANCK